MSELNYAQEAVLNGGSLDLDELFAGLVRIGALTDVASPTLYLPPPSEQRQGECKQSWFNVLAMIARRLSCANGIYVCRDSTDGEDEFSVTPGVIQHQGRWMTYAGEVNVGPLSRGSVNCIWLDVSGALPVAAFGSSFPGGPNVVRLGTITMPASGYWLGTIGGNLSRLCGGQGISPMLASPGVLKATLLFDSPGSLVVGRVAAGCSIGRRWLGLQTLFNGGEPLVAVGIDGAEEQLVGLGEFSLTMASSAGVWLRDGWQRYADETEIIATYTADGSTAGEAVIYLEVLP